MAWRGIHLSRSAYLSVDHRALKIAFRDAGEEVFHQSIEDLAYLILDTPDITLSGNLLASLAEANTLIIGVNSRHLPVWSSLPWTQYHRQGDVLKAQLETSLPQKKQLWAYIVKTKIDAQARCLALKKIHGSSVLQNMGLQVRSGDPDNTEARAARFYWQALFHDREFRRHDDDLPNILLNYGYAILRAALARQLCAVGFIPQLGIHHESLSNAYNLADDLIEPYRPIVDYYAHQVLGKSASDQEFTTDHRRAMAQILEHQLLVGDDVYLALPAIELTISTLKHALNSKNADRLIFPKLNP